MKLFAVIMCLCSLALAYFVFFEPGNQKAIDAFTTVYIAKVIISFCCSVVMVGLIPVILFLTCLVPDTEEQLESKIEKLSNPVPKPPFYIRAMSWVSGPAAMLALGYAGETFWAVSGALAWALSYASFKILQWWNECEVKRCKQELAKLQSEVE